MKRTIIATLIAVGLVALFAADVRPQQDEAKPVEPNQVAGFMHVKLLHSQKILEGLATEDYKMIVTHAQQLTLISQASNWEVLQTPKYLEQSKDFRHSTEAIMNNAQKMDLDGATMAFVETTVKCVNCHKYVRSVRPVPTQPAVED